MMALLETTILAATMRWRAAGPLRLDPALFDLFLRLPPDPLPEFTGPAGGLKGRGKDHPRYGRFMHAIVKYYSPGTVVEIGTNAGGTAVGSARALVENGSGRLICIDNGEGRPRSFPDVARANILKTGLPAERFELICADSRGELPRLAARLGRSVDICLVDAAHTYEAARADIEASLPMMRPGGLILVHDVDRSLDLGNDVSAGHTRPVYDAFLDAARANGLPWSILTFIRKHLGALQTK